MIVSFAHEYPRKNALSGKLGSQLVDSLKVKKRKFYICNISVTLKRTPYLPAEAEW